MGYHNQERSRFFYRTADDLWGEVWQGAFASPGINVPKRQLPNPTQPPPMIQFVGQMDQENNIPQPKPRITSPPPAHFSEMKPMKPFIFFSPQDNNLPLPDFQQPQQQQPTFLTQPPGSNIAEIPDYPMTEDPDYVDYQLQPTSTFELPSRIPEKGDAVDPAPIQELPPPDPTPLVTLEEAILANTLVIDDQIENADDPIYHDYQDYLDTQPKEQPELVQSEPQTINLTALQKAILKNAGMTDIPDQIELVSNTSLPQVIKIFAEEESALSTPDDEVDDNQFFEVIDLSKLTEQELEVTKPINSTKEDRVR